MNLPKPPAVGQGWSAQAIEAIWQKLQPKVKSLGYASPPVNVTALPTIPHDGDTITYKATAAATGALVSARWTLQYDAVETYWYLVGGGPALVSASAGSVASTISSTWQSTGSPIITVPFAGDYEVFVEGLIGQSTAAAEVALGPAQPTSLTPTQGYGQDAFTINATGSLNWTALFTVAAGAQFVISQFTSDSTPGHSASTNRYMFVRPIRVH